MQIRRKLIRILALILIFLAIFFPQSYSHAANIVVNHNGDTIADDGFCTLREAIRAANTNTASGASAGECAAGEAGVTDLITFAGDYTITLAGSQLPPVTSDINITGNGQTKTIIQASTCNPITLPGGCSPVYYRVLHNNGGDLTLKDLTIRHGNYWDGGGIHNRGFSKQGTLTLDSCTIKNNAADYGGGISNIDSITAITNSTISTNYAEVRGGGIDNAYGSIGNINNSTFEFNFVNTGSGGGIMNTFALINTITDSTFNLNFADSGSGGAIYNDEISRINTLTGSSFLENSAENGGGIALNEYGSITTLTNSTFNKNSASDKGGGLFIEDGGSITTISGSTFSENSAVDGGGIANTDYGLISTITTSDFSGNSATFLGGAVYNIDANLNSISDTTFSGNSAYYGGAIYNDNAGTITTISTSTFESNTASVGGAISNDDTIITIANSTFSNNSANNGGGIENNHTITSIANSTFSGNSASANGGGIINGGTISTIANSIFTDSPSGGNCAGSPPASEISNLTDPAGCWSALTTLDPSTHLGPLSSNGGPTQTHALLFSIPTNPAVNSGNTAICANPPVNNQDQRGVVRSDCDIGAFEYTASDGPPTVAGSDPADNSTKSVVIQIAVSFNKEVVSDGGADAANNPANYLLVEQGGNALFDSQSCLSGLLADDIQINIPNVSYDSASQTATLTLNPAPLPIGSYRLFVCGTTSIFDLGGLELNNGLGDTLIDFTILPGANTLPPTGFAPGRITDLTKQPKEGAYTRYSSLWLDIPRLGLELDIVGIPREDQSWNVSWLENQAGYLSGTAFPTWKGNTVLTGHVWDAWNQPGPFAELKTLQYGDQFSIHAFGQVYTYEVRDNFRIHPDNLNVLGHSDYDMVTLLTCERWSFMTGEYRYRRAVQAVLVKVSSE